MHVRLPGRNGAKAHSQDESRKARHRRPSEEDVKFLVGQQGPNRPRRANPSIARLSLSAMRLSPIPARTSLCPNGKYVELPNKGQ